MPGHDGKGGESLADLLSREDVDDLVLGHSARRVEAPPSLAEQKRADLTILGPQDKFLSFFSRCIYKQL